MVHKICARLIFITLANVSQLNNPFTVAFSDELQQSWKKIFHLTSNLLPHNLAKIECSTVHLYSTLLNANVMHIFYRQGGLSFSYS